MEQELYDAAQPTWLDALHKNPIPILLEAAALPIRYEVLRDILEDQESDDFKALQNNLRKHQPRRKKLAEQNEQGLWPIDGSLQGLSPTQIKTLQFIKQTESLHELLNFLITEKQEKVVLGMKALIQHLGDPDPQLRLHHISQAIYLAIAFKMDDDPIIKQQIWGILKLQNADGGWSSQAGDAGSCIWTTLFFLWAMAHSDHYQNNRSLQKGLRYVQSHLLEADHSELLPGMQVWDTLTTGTSGLSVLNGGTLRYLETIQLLGGQARDRKTEKLIDWLISVQLKNGLWPSIINRDKHGDFMVTLRVLKVIKHFQSKRIEETLNYDLDE